MARRQSLNNMIQMGSQFATYEIRHLIPNRFTQIRINKG
jgi:hypothetical protein